MSEETAFEDQNEADISEQVAVRRGRKPKAAAEDAIPATGGAFGAGSQDAQATPAKSAKFPVKLTRNYRPINAFTVSGEQPTEDQKMKVFAGAEIEVDRDEALNMMAKGIAVRNDPFG